MPDISRNAIVAKSAELAEDVVVGPFSTIGPHVRIGPGCRIANNVTIVGRTTLEENTTVFPMAVIGAPPGAGDRDGECSIGKSNCIREHVTVYAGEDRPTRVGKHNLIMIGSLIGAGAAVGDHGIFDNFSQIGAAACVEDYVRTSGFATVCDRVTVGAYSFVLGYALIDRDAPPFAMLQGSPFRVRGVNWRNLKRCGFGEDDIHALKLAFREIFNGNKTFADEDAMNRLAGEADLNPHVDRLIQATRRSLRQAGEVNDG